MGYMAYYESGIWDSIAKYRMLESCRHIRLKWGFACLKLGMEWIPIWCTQPFETQWTHMGGGNILSLTWMIGLIWQLSTHFWAPSPSDISCRPVRTCLLFPIVWLCNTMPLHNIFFLVVFFSCKTHTNKFSTLQAALQGPRIRLSRINKFLNQRGCPLTKTCGLSLS